nr:MAG TPA: hypothetical protein [Caudoviricetes sp.]
MIFYFRLFRICRRKRTNQKKIISLAYNVKNE